MTPIFHHDRLKPGGRFQRGAALMVVLWTVALLSIAVFSATQFLFAELESKANDAGIFQAELLADRGLALASHPEVKAGDPILIQEISEMEGFQARIGSEGGSLNLNFLLDPNHRIVLEEIFYQWGLRSDEAISVVDRLMDWKDSDSVKTGIGGEQSHYLSLGRLNHPFNRDFQTLDEVLLVDGFDRVAAVNPAWRDSFTLLSQGQLDLNDAPAELIAATCQSPLESARLFVQARNGVDTIQGTIDDTPVESVEEALILLGVSEDDMDIISQRVSIEDPVKRLVSIGRFGSIQVERTVSVQYNGENGGILRWSSRRIQ